MTAAERARENVRVGILACGCGGQPKLARVRLDGQRVYVLRCEPCGERVECDDLEAACDMWSGARRGDVAGQARTLVSFDHDGAPYALGGAVGAMARDALSAGTPAAMRAALEAIPALVRAYARAAGKGASNA